MIYNEGDRYLFNSCCQHSTGGVVRVSLCPLASPRKVLTEHSVAVRQTRKEFLQLIWWGREELFMPITTPQNSTTTFHSKTQFAETCSSRSRKFLGKYSNHVTGSRFCLQSSKHSPSHWPTETNPGHLSRPSSNLPLHDITAVHQDPQCPIPRVSDLSTAACAGDQCFPSACYCELMLSLGMPHLSCPRVLTWKL